MNGPAGNMASGASEKGDRGDLILSLSTVQRMLPLVRQIVEDVLRSQKVLDRLMPEQDRLDRQRRGLAWPERQRRYQLQEEVSKADRELQDSLLELQMLGVALLDPDSGRVGFPTMVNNRRAYFSWRLGEENLRNWHFAEESMCRPIPQAWLKEISFSGKS